MFFYCFLFSLLGSVISSTFFFPVIVSCISSVWRNTKEHLLKVHIVLSPSVERSQGKKVTINKRLTGHNFGWIYSTEAKDVIERTEPPCHQEALCLAVPPLLCKVSCHCKIQYGNNSFYQQTTALCKGLTTWHSPTPCLTLSSLADPIPTILPPSPPHTIGLIITLIVEQKHKSKNFIFPLTSLYRHVTYITPYPSKSS